MSTATSPLLRTTLSLVLLQLVSRLFSFSLNQLLLRSTTPQALGVATMGLEVIRDTGLFLVREGVRGAVIRNRTRKSDSTNATTLLSQTLLLPTLLAPILPLLFFLYSFLPLSPIPSYFHLTLILYALSGMIELVAERYYLETLKDWEKLTTLRVRVEGLAVGGKAIGTLVTVLCGGEKAALLAFGVGQVVYASTLLGGLWWNVGRGLKENAFSLEKVQNTTEVKEKKVIEEQYFDREIKQLSWALTKQSLVKQFLTEGDKIVVGRFSQVEDQGGYAIALNYGSLIARLLFQPLEETSRLYFSQSLSSPTPSTLLSTSSLLSSLLLLHTHLSLIFFFLAPYYTSPLLYYLLGPRWANSSAPTILKTYCTYLPFLAINGVTEAFFQSVAEEKWLKRGSMWMGICSLGFVAVVLVGMGGGVGGMEEKGLIWTNCFNMSMRIGFSSIFIKHYFEEQLSKDKEGMSEKEKVEIRKNLNWRSWTPKIGTLGVFALVWTAVKRSEERATWKTVRGMSEHLAVGAAGGLLCLGAISLLERKALLRLKGIIKPKKE